MIERGERARPTYPGGGFGAVLHLRAFALWTEVALGSVDAARLSLVAMSIVLQSVVLMSPGHFRPAPNVFFALFVVIGTLGSLVLCGVATTNIERFTSVGIRRVMALAALLLLAGFSVLGVQHAIGGARAYVQGQPYNNDGAVMDLYAATQFLHGKSPYVKANLPQALAALNAPATTTTPLMDGQFRGLQTYPSPDAVQQVFMNVLRHRTHGGVPIPPEFESKYNYPSGSFLLILPFVAAGIHDVRFLYLLFLVLMGVYLWYRVPTALRVLVPFLILADLPLIMLTSGGQPDTMYGFFMLIGLAEWRRRWTSPLAMGLAVATKQLAWFFLPFYLILVARRLGLREALRRLGIVGAIFLIFNGAFIIQAPASYLSSIEGPMTDPMFPLGTGIIALFVAGVFHLAPKAAFTVAEMTAWIAGATAFARTRLLVPATMAVLGALPLFFAWRSLANYFYLVPIVTLAIWYANTDHSPLPERT
jgi:hypothetical protein